MWALIVFVFFVILLCYGAYSHEKDKKTKGYIYEFRAKVTFAEGIDSKGDSLIRLYKDKIEINHIAIISLENVTTVGKITRFVRRDPYSSYRKIYFKIPFYNDMNINFKSVNGNNSSIRLETKGKEPYGLNSFRNKLLEILGVENSEGKNKEYKEPYHL